MVSQVAATVAVVEDHSLVRDGLVLLCREELGLTVVYSGANVDEVLSLEPYPDIVLLDLDLSGTVVSEQEARDLLDRGSRLIIVSALGSPSAVRSMIRAGASAFVSKRDTKRELVSAVREVLENRHWMTSELAAVIVADPQVPEFSAQERRALELYASGLKMQSVARVMGVQPTTAKEYIERVRAKYAAVGRHAPTKSHLTRNAHQDGVLD